MKKRTIILITIFSLAAVGGGGYGIYHLVKNGGSPVEVTSVANLNQGYWGSETSSSGTITSKANQEVHLDSNNVINQVYVKEGDKVKVGDKLLSYDTTLLELNLESYQLEGKSIELEIKGAEKDLKKLKAITPVADSSSSASSDVPMWDDSGSYSDSDSTLGDEARAVLNPLNLTAAAEGGDTEVVPAAETAAPETTIPEVVSPETTASETSAPETAAPETVATETSAPETSAPETAVAETKTSETKATETTALAADSVSDTITLDPSSGDGLGGDDTTNTVKTDDKVLKMLTYRSKPLQGSGTEEDPYVFVCAEGAVIQGSFLNKILGFVEDGSAREGGGMAEDGQGCYARLEIRKGNQTEGEVLSTLDIDGTKETDKAFAKDTKWRFAAKGGQLPANEEEGDGSRLTAKDGADFWTETISDEVKNATSESETGSSDVTDIVIGGDGSESGNTSETGSSETAASETNGTETPGTETETPVTESETPPTETSATETSATETETPGSETNATETPATETEEPVTEPETPVTEPATETEPTTETEPATETETPATEPATEEPEPSPLERIKAKKVLTYNTKPYRGEGTKENPYVFFCADGAVIRASFMNRILGFNESGTSREGGGMNGDGEGCYAVLEIREGDEMSGGFIKSLLIRGTTPTEKAFAPDLSWIFTTSGLQKVVPELPDETEETETESDDWYDPPWDDNSGDSYTASELKKAIEDKEKEIKDLQLNQRENTLKIEKTQREIDDSTVTSSIHGVVKSVGDPAIGEVDGKAFILVTSDSGLYVQGTLSESDLGKVKVGSRISGYSYESYTSFTAEITEISKYPATSQSYWSSDMNPNASSYPFLAYIENADGLSDYEYAELKIEEDASTSADSIYIDKMYIRKENGQSYVYIKGEDGLLKKQYVRTGKTLYGSTIEVKEGLSIDDAIAFPYGKNVKEGAKTKVASEYADDEDDNSSGMENYDSGMDNIDGENYDEGNYDEGSYEEGSYEEGAYEEAVY